MYETTDCCLFMLIVLAMHVSPGGGRARGAGRRGDARAAARCDRRPRRGPRLHSNHLNCLAVIFINISLY